MLSNLQDYLIGIAIGIRFRANFTIEDQLGNIVDKILYSKNSYFNPQMFPMVLSRVNEKILTKEETGDTLRINTSNIILELNYSDKIKPSDIDEINKRFNSDIVDGIMKDYRVTQINRIGYIKKYLFDIKDFSKLFLDRTIGNTFPGINDINLRFSKKYSEIEALAVKDINDYYNVIFNIIKTIDKEELYISVDYQKFFDPFLESPSQMKFLKFVERIEKFNSHDYTNWLNEYYGK